MPIRTATPSRVAKSRVRRYRSFVAANSATGFGDPTTVRRTSAPITIAGAFFVPAHPVYGGCARETLGSAGCLTSRFANLRTAATLNRLATISGSSNATLGVPPMKALIPPAIRALAHRRMALSALRANSSLSVRLKRYNDHMNIVRTLESQGCAMSKQQINNPDAFAPAGLSSLRSTLYQRGLLAHTPAGQCPAPMGCKSPLLNPAD